MAGAAGEGQACGRRVGRVGGDGEELVVAGEGGDGHGGLVWGWWCWWWWVCWVLVEVGGDALADGFVGVLRGGWGRRRGEWGRVHGFK